jgi:hypothetical protein
MVDKIYNHGISNVHLNKQSDVFRWSLKLYVQFSVSSMYQALLDSNIVPYTVIYGRLRYR